MLSVEQLRADVELGEITTVVVGFTDPYGRLMGKRFDARFFCDDVVGHGTHACDYLFTVNMAMEPVDGYAFAGWEQGYGDVHLVPDLATLRRAAWADSTALVLCDVATGTDDAAAVVAPRQILRRQLDRLADRGMSAKAASELEFYIYRESYRDADRARHTGLQPAGWYSEDYDLLQGARHEPYLTAARTALSASGVPVENTKGETGIGQHELNIAYADVLDMADRHVVLKQAMKELADAHGISVTFMAKPVSDDAGNSCHIHLSLWDGDANAFANTDPDTDGGDGRSDRFRWFLGGWMQLVPDFMVWYAPTINSYKRYVDASWAPTRLAWATDNRTAGFRVVGHGASLRIECRLPGADVNPYLAYAAAIASGLYGIENQIEPPAEFSGDAYRSTDIAAVPGSLWEATELFAASVAARAAVGDDVVDHYARFYRNEVAEFSAAVTDWERNRYFERI